MGRFGTPEGMMSDDQVVVAAIGGGALAFLCALGVLSALVRRGRFRRELAAVRAGTYPKEIAYQRYARVAAARLLVIRVSLFVVLLMVIIVVPLGATPDAPLAALAATFGSRPTLGLALAFLLPLISFPALLYGLLAAALADAPALAQLRGLPTRPRDLVAPSA